MRSALDKDTEEAWKHLYRNVSNCILHSAILNKRYDYIKEYLDRGADVNAKDFQDWTPLHCAVYLGDTRTLKQVLSRVYISIHEKNDEGKTPIQLAIETGNVFGEENACS